MLHVRFHRLYTERFASNLYQMCSKIEKVSFREWKNAEKYDAEFVRFNPKNFIRPGDQLEAPEEKQRRTAVNNGKTVGKRTA